MKRNLALFSALMVAPLATLRAADKPPRPISTLIEQNCLDCHDGETKKGALDLTELTFDLTDPKRMERWVQIFDRVEKKEMPPANEEMTADDRKALLAALESPLYTASAAATAEKGRGPMRRLNRIEFEQNLREAPGGGADIEADAALR